MMLLGLLAVLLGARTLLGAILLPLVTSRLKAVERCHGGHGGVAGQAALLLSSAVCTWG